MKKKISKSVLKEIVKECLVEILSEGLSSSTYLSDDLEAHRASRRHLTSQLAESQSRARRPASGVARTSPGMDQMARRPALDAISYDRAPEQPDAGYSRNERFEKNVTSTVASITDDPIMGSIFSDTARTTLQEQVGDNSSSQATIGGGGDAAAKKSLASDPMSMFGDASNNWAALAFSDKKRPGS